MSEPTRHKLPWRLLERDQLVLYALSLLLLVTAAYRYAASGRAGTRNVRKLEHGMRVDYRVDLNKADAAELTLLPGIGPAKAARIIAYRNAHCPFRCLADLANVAGISRGHVEKLRGLVAPDDTLPPGETPR